MNWMSGAVDRTRTRLGRFAADARGNVAIMFGLALPVLILMTMGGIDISRLTTVKMNLQDALDAAALAAARSPHMTDAQIKEVGWASLQANLAAYPEIEIVKEDVTFTLVDDTIIANAKATVETIAAHIFLPPYGQLMDKELPIGSHSEVQRAKDIEVALVLDITGSMNEGSRLADLKTASRDLVEVVVREDDRRGNRTRVALVPYSMGVNVGDYADQVRGKARDRSTISAAAWADGPAKTISAISINNPGVLRSNGHGLTSNDFVYVTGVASQSSGSGNDLSGLFNGKIFKVQVVDGDRFRLQPSAGGASVNTENRRAYASGGQVRKCIVSTCEVVVSSTAHGLAQNEMIRLASIAGMTNLNGDDRTVARVIDPDHFVPSNAFGPEIGQAYSASSGDYVQCLSLGCKFYRFRNLYNGNYIVKEPSTCVSERQGSNAHKEVSASVSRVGWTYPSTDNGCLAAQITPLTSDRDVLYNQIGGTAFNPGYVAVGSTAGQIGVEWGWYMISPTFGSIFPEANRPEAYEPSKRVKVVILMTDGEFNTPYCEGVVAGAISGSGDTKQHIRCPGTVNNPFAFSVSTCNAMKAQGVTVYTVGFAISDSYGGAGVDTAREVMAACATSPDHAYLPKTGASLKSDFAEIGRKINQLRISR